jgi:hypothetical protein|tara:strand:+ start:276 stop:647 length:372 start_codon:yes stop_codon:yes gene_type:complete
MKTLFNFVFILLFAANVSANEKIFYENDNIKGTIFLWSVENAGSKTKAFISFQIKKNLTVIKTNFYSQYLEYNCGASKPKILEEKLTVDLFGAGEKIIDSNALQKIRKEVEKSYPSFYEEICI